MKPPIIVYDHGDVSIFRSAEDAERYFVWSLFSTLHWYFQVQM